MARDAWRSLVALGLAVFAAGLAACICDRGAISCGGQCVDVVSSNENCGACGTRCAADEVCRDGMCALVPGECRPACPGLQRCVEGRCLCVVGTTCGSACVDVMTDPTYCGSCFERCSAAATCVDGECTCPAAAPDACRGDCVDTQTSSEHCGACGRECPATAECVAGACVCPGDPGLSCGGSCVDGATSVSHCGACDHACVLGCVDGECIGVARIALGGSHTLALLTDGTSWSWGYNVYCQLGDGTCGGRTSTPAPTILTAPVDEIAAGQGHSCVLARGRVSCLGWDMYGQIGNGVVAFAYDGPVPVELSDVVQIEAGLGSTFARLRDGSVWAWGRASDGVSDSESSSAVPTPTRWGTFDDVIDIAAGGGLCARRSGGQVHCTDPSGNAGEWPRERTEWLGATDVAVGEGHACAVLDGQVSCVGANGSGEIGIGMESIAVYPPADVSIPERIETLALGVSTSCARAMSGQVYCWGAGSAGLTGPAGTWHTLSPLRIPSTAGSRALACGHNHCCVLFDELDLRCWGDNFNGQLGSGVGDDRTTPASVRWR